MEQKTMQEAPRSYSYVLFSLATVMLAFGLYAVIAVAVQFILGEQYVTLGQASGQLLGMAGVAIVLAGIPPLGRNKMLRLLADVTPLQWAVGIIGAVALQYMSNGLISLIFNLLGSTAQKMLLEQMNQLQQMYSTLLGGETIGDYVKAVVVGAVIPAFAEELLFRGVLQRSLEQRYSPFVAILVTSAVFSLMHFSLAGLLPIFFVGIFLGLLAFYTGSIALPIVAHFFFNVLAVIGMYVQNGSVENEMLSMPQSVMALVLGGGVFAFACILLVQRTPMFIESAEPLPDDNEVL